LSVRQPDRHGGAKRKEAITATPNPRTWTVMGVSAGGLLLGIAIALFIGLKAMSQPIAGSSSRWKASPQ